MKRLTELAVVFALATLVGVGCGKKESPTDSAASASAAPAPAPVPTPTSSAATVDAGTTTPPPVVTAPVTHASLDACCAGLSAIASSGRDKAAKLKAASAARVCPGIAARVKSGQVPRSEALAQILSAMTGLTIPNECK